MDKNSKQNKKRYETIKTESGDLETKYSSHFNEKGQHTFKEKSKIKKGKLAKGAGSRFELKIRKYWEDNKYTVDKWSNNIDLENNQILPAKRKYNPFKRVMTIGTGFPDFIAFKSINQNTYDVIGIEVKMNGTLSKEEKEKCKWYLNNKIFSKIFIAKKGKKRGEIEHIDFSQKFNKI